MMDIDFAIGTISAAILWYGYIMWRGVVRRHGVDRTANG